MNRTKRCWGRASLLAWACALAAVCACGGGRYAAQEADDEAAGGIDRTNPETVARAFLVACKANKVKEALTYVLPSQKESVETALENEGIPNIPDNLVLEVAMNEVTMNAGVKVKGTGIGIELQFFEGKWWVQR